MNKRIRMILVEDEPAILRGLAANIRHFEGDYEIVATAYNGMDALEKIQKHKPDILITDIRMPLMDGLDLIEAVRRTSKDMKFVILTGYAEFGYAKRAMKLQVVDYLLKPVDPDVLEKLLEKLRVEILTKREKAMREYLAFSLYRDAPKSEQENPFVGTTLYLLFAFYGSVTAGIYNELAMGSLIAQDSDYEFLREEAAIGDICIFPLRGNYRNETVFAIVAESAHSGLEKIIKSVAGGIQQKLLSGDIFVNGILSNPMTDGKDIGDHIQSCYLYAASHIVFGHSRLMVCQGVSDQTENMAVTAGTRELIKELKPIMDREEIEGFARALVKNWSVQEATQLQIQTDLHFILDTAIQKADSPYDSIAAPSELLASSVSYEELSTSLALELHKLCAGMHLCETKMPHTQAVAEKVRSYIDRNYTQSITYKNFTEIFGYHAKYISAIFKEAYGILPSKYILELRLTAAKNLMRENPDMRLKDIAQAVGYDDQLYFSRVFKNSQGMSPRAYQKGKC